mgnify:CR=1 FL=1
MICAFFIAIALILVPMFLYNLLEWNCRHESHSKYYPNKSFFKGFF